MSATPTGVETSERAPSRPPPSASWRALLVAIRFVLALLLSLLVCRLLWQFVPNTLSSHDGVLGYPVFADFDITRYYDAFYLLVIAFPLVTIVAYHLLARVLGAPSTGRAPMFLSRSTPARGT